jgi:transcription elongation factor
MDTDMKPLTPSPYTNEATPELLLRMDKAVFTDEQIAEFDVESQAMIRQQQEYCKAHPVTGIYRLATEGSQTRDGGVIERTGSIAAFTLDDGQEVRGAHKGYLVIYPDGSSAKIITGAGSKYSDIALVGSRLDNGDEIINTLQHMGVIVARKDVPLPEDFLPTIDG